jgi:hypothetical protein
VRLFVLADVVAGGSSQLVDPFKVGITTKKKHDLLCDQPRSPLTELTMSRAQKTTLPALRMYGVPAGMSRSSVLGEEATVDSYYDLWWAENLFWFAGVECPERFDWVAQVSDMKMPDGRLIRVEFSSTHTFHNEENWDAENVYAVTPEFLKGVMSGKRREFFDFLVVEGLLARLMLYMDNTYYRLEALRCWIIVFGRFCGSAPIADVCRSLEQLQGFFVEGHSCPERSDSGMFKAFDKFASRMARQQSLWLDALRYVDYAREDCVRHWCFDTNVCGYHEGMCPVLTMEPVDDWSETEKNTEYDSDPV